MDPNEMVNQRQLRREVHENSFTFLSEMARTHELVIKISTIQANDINFNNFNPFNQFYVVVGGKYIFI
jgi:hypothetical protein